MPLILLAAILAILVYLPSLWVRRVMSRYSRELPELPGTGGELARHLIDRFELTGVGVEETGQCATVSILRLGCAPESG